MSGMMSQIMVMGAEDDAPRPLREACLLLSGADVGRMEKIRIGDFDIVLRVNASTWMGLHTLGMAALDDEGKIWAATWCFARDRHQAYAAAKRLASSAGCRKWLANTDRIFDAAAVDELTTRGEVTRQWNHMDVRVRVRAWRRGFPYPGQAERANIAVLTPHRGRGSTVQLCGWHTPAAVVEMAEAMIPGMVGDRLTLLANGAFGDPEQP